MPNFSFPPSTSDWWSDLTPIEQSDYLEEHPRSRKQQQPGSGSSPNPSQDPSPDVEDSGLPIDADLTNQANPEPRQTESGPESDPSQDPDPEPEPEANPESDADSDVQDSGLPIDLEQDSAPNQDSNPNQDPEEIRFDPADVEEFVGPPNPSPVDQPILDQVEDQIDADPELAEQEQIVDQAFSGQPVNADKFGFALDCLLVLAAIATVASFPGAADLLAPMIYTVSEGWVAVVAGSREGSRDYADYGNLEDEAQRKRKKRIAEHELSQEQEEQLEQATHPDAEDRLRDHELELTDVGIDRDGNPRNPSPDRSLSSSVKRRASVLIAQSFLNASRRKGII